MKTKVTDIDVYRAANLTIKEYDDPVFHAADRYDELLEAGDLDRCRLWNRIHDAIKELQNMEPDAHCVRAV